jgi:hypothetical protein
MVEQTISDVRTDSPDDAITGQEILLVDDGLSGTTKAAVLGDTSLAVTGTTILDYILKYFALAGSAATAAVLKTARTINGVSFDGSANITVTADANTLSGTTLKSTVVNSSLTSVGTLTSLTVNAIMKVTGIKLACTAGSTVAVGEVCFLASDGKWDKVDGILDGTDVGFSKMLGICLANANDTQATEMLTYGSITYASFPTLTVGSPVYLADTAGTVVVAQPSTTNFAIRVIGFATATDTLFFNPSNDFMVYK